MEEKTKRGRPPITEGQLSQRVTISISLETLRQLRALEDAMGETRSGCIARLVYEAYQNTPSKNLETIGHPVEGAKKPPKKRGFGGMTVK